jgi:hypothetical protein
MLLIHLPACRSTTSKVPFSNPGNEQAFTFDFHIHVVKAAFDIRQGDRLNEPKRLLAARLRKGNPAVSDEEETGST